MLSLIVVFADVGGDGACRGIQSNGAEGEAGDVFEDVGVFDGVGGIFAPGKGRMAGDEDSRDGDGVQIL